MSLLKKSEAYKPHKYPWAFEAYQKQQQMHWIPSEIPMHDDVLDFKTKLTEKEKNFLTSIFRFFTQADVDVAGGYFNLFIPKFKSIEVRMMLSSFCNMEAVHIDSYSMLMTELGMPDSEFHQFLKYDAMRQKHDYALNFNTDTPRDTLKTLAVYSAFTEGMQLFASFAMLLNFSRHNKMKGMSQIVTYSIRDETLHTNSMIELFHEYARETGLYDSELKEEIKQIAIEMVQLEDAFVDLAFDGGEMENLTAQEVKNYVRFVCDWRLEQLKIEPVFNITKHPLPWLPALLNGVEHSNFFEQRSTEYSKGSTSGTWSDVWSDFDKPKKGDAL